MINRMYVITLLSVLPFTACGSAQGGEKAEAPEVYFIREITPQNMVRIYEALERPATGKVAVKLSTGEPGGHNFLKPELIKDIVTKVGGTIVECNTAYGGGRARTQDHLKAAADHGFTAIAPVDIMDADGEVSLPVKGGKHLKENFVGSHYPRYDFTVVLSHFKGHAMGGFGGAVKNISIGIASSAGKAWIHSAGKTKNAAEMWSNLPAQDDFLESMAESAKSVADHCGDKILYISVMNNLSVDCDCDAHPEDGRHRHPRLARSRGAGQGVRRHGVRIARSGEIAPDRAHGVAPRHSHARTRRSHRAGFAAVPTRGTEIAWSTGHWAARDCASAPWRWAARDL